MADVAHINLTFPGPDKLTVYSSLRDRVTINFYNGSDCSSVIDLTPEAARALSAALLAHARAVERKGK